MEYLFYSIGREWFGIHDEGLVHSHMIETYGSFVIFTLFTHWYSFSLFALMGAITEATGKRPNSIVCGKPAGSCPLVARMKQNMTPFRNLINQCPTANKTKVENACTRTDVGT